MSSSPVARPKSVRILGKRHTINYLPSEEMPGAFGLCHNGKLRIDVLTEIPQAELADTVLHEVLHAILFQMFVDLPPKVEERFVRTAATGLYAVLQDNPQFAKWLIQPSS